MSNAIQLADKVKKLTATEVVRDDEVRNQFISVYNAIWHEGGEAFYEREANYMMHAMRNSEKLQKCSPMSVFVAFIDLAVQNLSLEPGTRCLAFMQPRNFKQIDPATGKDYYVQRCLFVVSGYGELVMRQRAGQIRYADNPVVVYDGDEFAFGERDGKKVVNYICSIPRKSNKIIACFIKITRMDGSIDYSVMLEDDWKRLQGYSAKNNAYTDRRTGEYKEPANKLYTSNNGSIDTGFLMAKCIKHAFKSYPKIKIGGGTMLQSDAVDQPSTSPYDVVQDPYGGIDNVENEQQIEQEQSFGPQPQTVGVTIDNTADPEDDGAF